jgi:hypothetical protein
MNYNWIISAIFVVGIGFLIHFIYLFYCSIATKKWLSVKGEIVYSKLDVTRNMGEELMTSYKACIKYQYVIGREKYFSGRVFYGDYIERNFSVKPNRTIKKYIVGKTVQVYYSPTNNNNSVLETGVNATIYRELFVGILFLALSVFMVLQEDVLHSLFP